MCASKELNLCLLVSSTDNLCKQFGPHAGSRGGDMRSGSPLKNLKNIGFLSNTGPDPLQSSNMKATKLSQHSMLGHYRHASETQFKWCFPGGPIMAHFQRYLDPLSHKKKKKKGCQSWTPSGNLNPRKVRPDLGPNCLTL